LFSPLFNATIPFPFLVKARRPLPPADTVASIREAALFFFPSTPNVFFSPLVMDPFLVAPFPGHGPPLPAEPPRQSLFSREDLPPPSSLNRMISPFCLRRGHLSFFFFRESSTRIPSFSFSPDARGVVQVPFGNWPSANIVLPLFQTFSSP